jgi:hypothetical protein
VTAAPSDVGDRLYRTRNRAARRARNSLQFTEPGTVGYKAHGMAGMLTLFIRGMLCNWMVSTGVVGAMISTSVSGKVIAMWMPITVRRCSET